VFRVLNSEKAEPVLKLSLLEGASCSNCEVGLSTVTSPERGCVFVRMNEFACLCVSSEKYRSTYM